MGEKSGVPPVRIVIMLILAIYSRVIPGVEKKAVKTKF